LKPNGHPPGSDGQIAAALKRYNGGRVLVFVVGAFAEMSEDVSRICGIIAHDLARTHVSYYNDDAKRIKGMFRQRIQKAWGRTAHRGWARLLLNHARDLITHDPAHHGANGAAMPTDEGDQDDHFFFYHPERGVTPETLPRRAQPLLLLFRSNSPPHRGGGWGAIIKSVDPGPPSTKAPTSQKAGRSVGRSVGIDFPCPTPLLY